MALKSVKIVLFRVSQKKKKKKKKKKSENNFFIQPARGLEKCKNYFIQGE